MYKPSWTAFREDSLDHKRQVGWELRRHRREMNCKRMNSSYEFTIGAEVISLCPCQTVCGQNAEPYCALEPAYAIGRHCLLYILSSRGADPGSESAIGGRIQACRPQKFGRWEGMWYCDAPTSGLTSEMRAQVPILRPVLSQMSIGTNQSGFLVDFSC